jgi:hypothetical protein
MQQDKAAAAAAAAATAAADGYRIIQQHASTQAKEATAIICCNTHGSYPVRNFFVLDSARTQLLYIIL